MKEFTINTGRATHHDFYDSLPKFAQGYIQAAFFSSIYYCDESGNAMEIIGLGLDNIDINLLAGMAGDAIRFQIENAKELTVVCSGKGYDMRIAGNGFWLTRNSYVGAYWDQEIDRDIDGVVEAMRWLRVSAHGMGEFTLFAEPLHASPDILDVSGWEVKSDVWPDAATAEEWATAIQPEKTYEPVTGGKDE